MQQSDAAIIPLTQGLVTIVDVSAIERLSLFSWCASRHRDLFYAVRGGRIGEPSKVYMHREVFGAALGEHIDHRNTQTLDNRRRNLRVATESGNQQNQYKPRGISGFKGVSWHAIGNKWQAHIRVRHRTRYLGLFESEVDAARAYDAAAIEIQGHFANLNFPEDPTIRIEGRTG